MGFRPGSRRAAAAERQAARGGPRAYKKRLICVCGNRFAAPVTIYRSWCPTCADRFTIYDRPRAIGSIPENLKLRLEEATGE